MNCKKLIEVAMPVKEISAESVRDKSIRHGHISTLHLWWARRPLPVCRAVVFASLVPDPLDENCPKQFREAVKKLLSSNTYKPYEDIPFTAAADKMEDNYRNRLLMFIGKFSTRFIKVEKTGEGTCPPKEILDAGSLIKWENKNNEHILNIARKLIFVAHNSKNNISSKSSDELLNEFDSLYKYIKDSEKNLYNIPDRHLQTEKVKSAEKTLNNSIEVFLNKMPKVYDPFAGGGAIPLEAARLGCRTYANDLNPVAHIIEKASVEFPQKFGKPIYYSKEEFIKIYGKEEFQNQKESGNTVGDQVYISNILSFDVGYYANKLLKLTEDEVGYLYPSDDKGNKAIAYLWARIGHCSNPSCKAKVPLLKRMILSNTSTNRISLYPEIDKKNIGFTLKKKINNQSWISRGNMICPVCNNTTDVTTLKEQFVNHLTNDRLLAVIWQIGSKKEYKLPTERDLSFLEKLPSQIDRPLERMPIEYTQALPACTWGFQKWSDLFSDRQMLSLNTIIQNLVILNDSIYAATEYKQAIISYLAILINRISQRLTTFGIWDISRENAQAIFGRQAISMMFDYPEVNPFSDYGGGANNQLEWILRYIDEESNNTFSSICLIPSSGEKIVFNDFLIDSCITDPPYYDAIAYADLSDFFYTWFKRTLISTYPKVIAYPLTPKSDECTALKHHNNGDYDKAKRKFENKLQQIFSSVKKQMNREGLISIMFAHQTTEAWTTLCNSILNSGMSIYGSWSLDTEYSFTGLKQNKAFLATSVTVACKPVIKNGLGNSTDVKEMIEIRIKKEINELYKLGFRGTDLLTSCFGPAVSEFGKYEKVEKANGEEVTVEELLTWARDAAFNAIVSDIATDDYTRFYIGWLNLFGFTETEHDDVRRITQIGLNIDVNELLAHNLILQDGNKQALATFKDRSALNKKLGDANYSFTIDKVHKLMYLLKSNNRKVLLNFINDTALTQENIVWRVCNSLKEVLPKGMEDHTIIAELLANRDNLIKEAKGLSSRLGTQEEIFS